MFGFGASAGTEPAPSKGLLTEVVPSGMAMGDLGEDGARGQSMWAKCKKSTLEILWLFLELVYLLPVSLSSTPFFSAQYGRECMGVVFGSQMTFVYVTST